MVDEKKYENQVISHRMVNYIHASLEGLKFYHTTLQELGSSSYSDEKQQRLNELTQKSEEWLNDIMGGEVIFDLSLGREQSEKAQEVRTMLKQIKDDVLYFSEVIINIIQNVKFYEEKENIFFLIAANGRRLFCEESYAKGFLEFARVFNDQIIKEAWEPVLAESTPAINDFKTFVKSIKDNYPTENSIFFRIHFESLILPGIFRAYAHDIYQFLNMGIGEFNYTAAKIDNNNARIWERLDFSAFDAGYWNAYGFTPEQAQEWRKIGFNDPYIAGQWRVAGYEPNQALQWTSTNLSPLLATIWKNNHYSPEEAVQRIQNGELVPREPRRRDY